ncbi:EAL domain-containing protein [Halomonas sp. DN3]|uniref:bifunctional diguanylate cyclase/phosphodiesterase n=1 Tax=Halomonas sp. DN3 TaxID=2953657 RepID=UPI00209F0CBB|nr:EAL domain-containing protein [Halomonas sp. DN3]USZ50547.1 EAL domain-containing protein [Halomonas sp. DN3]
MPVTSPSRPERLRLGLTWRVVTLTSLLLVALAVLFTYLSHTNLTRQFTATRQEQIERQQRELEFAIRRSEKGLQQLAGLIAASPDLGPALEQGAPPSPPEALSPALASLWPSLQLEAGIEQMLVYDDRTRAVMSLGLEPGQSPPPHYRRWVESVMSRELPLSPLECSPECRQYAVVPILADGGSAGTLLLSRSLADVARQTREISTSEVALISVDTSATEAAFEPRRLDGWKGRVQAVTNASQSLPLLHQASRKGSLEALAQEPLRLEQQGRHLELSAVPLTSSSGARAPAYFVLISDITTQIHAIQLDTRTQMMASLFGWLSAELLLLAILLRPMARLRRVASVLPPLASGGFSQAREALPLAPRRLPDEIDVLESSTLTLADKLERLQRQVAQRGDELARRIDELARERDFVSNLIDTAQVHILTLDEEGRIDMVNDYLKDQLGCPSQELLGRRFDDIFGAGPGDSEPSQPLHQEERTLTLPDGEPRTIIWYHSPLKSGAKASLARISVGLDITERKAAEARLTWLAERDPLTELYNRRFFLESLRKALARDEQGVVMLLDLDQFKEVNELSGHHAGDRMLHTVARLLQQEYAHRGVISRLGGDEFALLLPGVDDDHAIRVAQHLNQLFESLGFVAEGRRHRVTASIGIVPFPTEGATPADLMASADVAMYKAKASNLQRWHLLATLENARDELNERVYWVDRIRRALVEGDFVLMVQPIVRLEDRSIRHYEVLLRMRDDDGSLISPARFIPVAEHSGQIVAIDRWVLHHCVHALARLEGISLAVNLSGQSLHDEGLKQYLANLLTVSQADPHHLVLEVTETAAVTDFSTARGVLQSVRDLGCRTALDDFGVGFSSFHYLGQLPVDYIKIDGSFIRSLATNPDSRVIVKAVSDIATGFGKQAVAEFVDQEALVPLLSSYNITYGQGYHLGRPVPFKEVFAFDPVIDIDSVN